MQLITAGEMFSPDEAGFKRRIIDDGEGPIRVYAYSNAPTEDSLHHCHTRATELFVAIEGDGIMVVDDEEVRMSRGDALIVEPGEFHFVRTRGEQFTLLCIVAPNTDDLELKQG